MSQATVTSKGQITIPKPIRDTLYLRKGDKVDFIISQKGDAIMRAVSKCSDEVFGMLASHKRKPLPIEEINKRLKKSLRGKEK